MSPPGAAFNDFRLECTHGLLYTVFPRIVVHAPIRNPSKIKSLKTAKNACFRHQIGDFYIKIIAKFSDLYSGMHLYTSRPDFFEVEKKCTLDSLLLHAPLPRFRMHRCMHHNTGEYDIYMYVYTCMYRGPW